MSSFTLNTPRPSLELEYSNGEYSLVENIDTLSFSPDTLRLVRLDHRTYQISDDKNATTFIILTIKEGDVILGLPAHHLFSLVKGGYTKTPLSEAYVRRELLGRGLPLSRQCLVWESTSRYTKLMLEGFYYFSLILLAFIFFYSVFLL